VTGHPPNGAPVPESKHEGAVRCWRSWSWRGAMLEEDVTGEASPHEGSAVALGDLL